MNKKIKLLVLSSILIVVLYLSFKLPADEKKDIENFGEKAIGTLSHHGLKTIDISYKYQDQNFSYTRSIPYSHLAEGEQFEITVSKKNPSRVIVHMDKPYLDTIAFKFISIKPTEVSTIFVDDTELQFDYVVNALSYHRIQKYYCADSIPNDLKNLFVKYRSDRPEIGYLSRKNN